MTPFAFPLIETFFQFDYRPYVASSEVLSIYALICALFILYTFAVQVWNAVGDSRLVQDYLRWLRLRKTAMLEFFDESLRFPQFTNVYYRFLDERYGSFAHKWDKPHLALICIMFRRKLTLDQWQSEQKNGFVIHENGMVFRLGTSHPRVHPAFEQLTCASCVRSDYGPQMESATAVSNIKRMS